MIKSPFEQEQIPELKEYEKRLREQIRYYSNEELLERCVSCLEEDQKLEALIITEYLEKRDIDDSSKRRNGLYKRLNLILGYSDRMNLKEESIFASFIINSKKYDEDPVSICKIIKKCMMESSLLYSEGLISKDEFFKLERIIDRLPIKKLSSNDIELERVYTGFKNYAIDVYLKGKDSFK